MYTLGLLASVLIGISLGLIGGGGSILTVPVLVYLLGVDPVLSTGYSLFIVGITSAVGSIPYFRASLVHLPTVLSFGFPSIVSVFLTRAYLLPAIPETILISRNLMLDRGTMLMLLFALLMLVASIGMITPNRSRAESIRISRFAYPLVIFEGLLVGMLTGLVGAGGGFLIIPALVILGKLPIKEAIGTSLLIIAAKSLLGLVGENGLMDWNWKLLFGVIGLAIGGLLIGVKLSQSVDGAKLKPAFGWFVLLMGIYMIIKETLLS
ncbi:MAG: sulfite exporter TauE/SafE family protein [Porphyromonadaceae bacterium]|nr:sulfite exporter TauE/SafE family protein [Porphyromonadaceae bacterium]